MTRSLSDLMREINEQLNGLDALASELREARHRYSDSRAQAFLDACNNGRREAAHLNPLESK